MNYVKLSIKDKIINWIMYNIIHNFVYYIVYPIKFNTRPFEKDDMKLTKKHYKEFIEEVNTIKNDVHYSIHNIIKLFKNTPYRYIDCIDRYIVFKISNEVKDMNTVKYLRLYENYINDKENEKNTIDEFLKNIKRFDIDIQLWIISLIMIKIGYCKYVVCK